MPKWLSAAMAVCLLVFANSIAKADELQFGNGVVSFSSATNGTNTGVNFGIDTFTVSLSNPGGDTAVGSTVSFGTSQPVAFFASTNADSDTGVILSAPQSFSISGAGGTLSGNIDAITLVSSSPGIFGLVLTVDSTSLSGGATSTVLNELASTGNGQSKISFQFTDSDFQTVSQITGFTGSDEAATASGSISSTPEPGSMLLLGSGLVGLGTLRRRWLK